jgi:ParB family chromosome partitioning protein
MTEIQHIPTAAIDAHALPRDRSVIDPAALDELAASIRANGLRLPVELHATPGGYGLVSGYRRLMAVRSLEERHGEAFATIPALVGPAESQIDGFARVVEENDIRQGLTPWDRGRTLVVAREMGLDTLDAALAKLYPAAPRRKRARLRVLAEVVDAMDGWLETPEDWSENRLLRLGSVLRSGWDKLLYAALDDAAPGAEWEALLPLIEEAEALPVEKRNTPDRPRRLAFIPRGLTIRREKTKTGFVLHITGRRATDAVVGEVMEEIERMFEG